MTTQTRSKYSVWIILRWATRVFATLLAALFVFIFVAESISDGLPPFASLSAIELVEFAMLALMVVGALLSWRWERVAGTLCIIAGLGFTLAESIQAGRLDLVWFPVDFLLIGVLLWGMYGRE